MVVEFNRWFLGVFFLLVAVFYVVRILQIRSRIGHSPVFAGRPFSLHFFAHLTFRVFRAAILVVCLVRLAWPPFDTYLVPFTALWHPAILISGDVLLAGGFALAAALHFHLGVDWRSGVRRDGAGRLATDGPYRRSRNPAMLGVLAAQAGLFLALPSAFTLICLIAGWLAVHAQVRVEEAALSRLHGKAYEDYRARVPRWLGLSSSRPAARREVGTRARSRSR